MSAQKPENRPLTTAMVNALQYTIGTPDTYKPQANTLKALEKRGLIEASHKLTLAGVEAVKDGDNNAYFIISLNNTMGDSYTTDDAITGIDNAVELAKTHLQKAEWQNISVTIYTTDTHRPVITLTKDDLPDSSIDDLSSDEILEAIEGAFAEVFPQDFTPMLAHRWDEKTDPTGWYMSEKLDGVRAIWTGEQLQTRTGKKLHAPAWFIKDLPATPLDGELTLGRGQFQQTVGIVRQHNGDWTNIQYHIFDVIDFEKTYSEREGILINDIFPSELEHCRLTTQMLCRNGTRELYDFLQSLENRGAEGIMLRNPDSLYQQKRSRDLLKVKSHKSAEATVIGYTDGKGKHTGVIGALQCKDDNGKSFKLGTGLSDAERQNPPAIGERVTYQYFELTQAGAPRFPVYITTRNYE